MDAYLIEGGRPLKGTVVIGGSKNASLPCLFASLLTAEPLHLLRVPFLRDTKTAAQLLAFMGKKVSWETDGLLIEEEANLEHELQRELAAPYHMVRQMRASALVAGAMLARWGKARVALPGGCAIGLRPLDIHIDGFKAMGAKAVIERGDLILTAPQKKLRGVRYKLSYPSVGATENLLMAASLNPAPSILENAAREPEIGDLAALLKKMGAQIKGIGTQRLEITGSSHLNRTTHAVMPDRIETGSYALFAACVPNSDVYLSGCEPRHLANLWLSLKKTGARVMLAKDSVRLKTKAHFRPKAFSIKTGPYPAFPTDLQPLWMAFMAKAKGRSIINETVFEKRFLHAAEMARMGAQINTQNNKAIIHGAPELLGAGVMTSDLRAGAGLIACALAARGQSTISRIYHIERGYEKIEDKLSRLGARINRINEGVTS